MKVSLIAISVIIALQATSFIHGSQQRYNYHHTLHQISQTAKTYKLSSSSCECFCYHFSQEIRYGIIAFMYGAALLLFTGEAVWPAFLSQLFWIVLQGYLCTEKNLPNIRNLAVQLLILFVLASNIQCCSGSSKCGTVSKQNSIQSQKQSKQQLASQQPPKQNEAKMKKQQKQQKDTKNQNQVKKNITKTKTN